MTVFKTNPKTRFSNSNTPEYKSLTANRRTEYYLRQNFARYPKLQSEFDAWKKTQKNFKQPSYQGVFSTHPDCKPSMMTLEKLLISEDLGQRNALADPKRHTQLLGMAKNFDVLQMKPLVVDIITDNNGVYYVCRDGAGTAHVAYMLGLKKAPAIFRNVGDWKTSRALFLKQKQFEKSIGPYTKHCVHLNDTSSKYHNQALNLHQLSNSGAFDISVIDRHHSHAIPSIGLLKRAIKNFGGDHEGTKWGSYKAPRLMDAVGTIKAVFPTCDVIPGNLVEAFTAFCCLSTNWVPATQPARHQRYVDFLEEVKMAYLSPTDGIEELMTKLEVTSSNKYAQDGAVAFMTEWNKLMLSRNKGRRNGLLYPAFSQKHIAWMELGVGELPPPSQGVAA